MLLSLITAAYLSAATVSAGATQPELCFIVPDERAPPTFIGDTVSASFVINCTRGFKLVLTSPFGSLTKRQLIYTDTPHLNYRVRFTFSNLEYNHYSLTLIPLG